MCYRTYVHKHGLSWSCFTYSWYIFVNPWRHSGSLLLCNSLMVGWDCVSVEMLPLIVPLPVPRMTGEWLWIIGKMVTNRENETLETSVTLSTTRHICTSLGLNPDLREWNPATNPLSHETAKHTVCCIYQLFNVRNSAFCPHSIGLYDCRNEPLLSP
jgi:hypothetical protein